jgi:nitronate monooxygenase
MVTRRLPAVIAENISLPIIAAPMFLVSGPDLVLATCQNGVIGSFPTPNARTIEILDEWMGVLTTKLAALKTVEPGRRIAPWAANIVAHQSYKRLQQDLDLIVKYRAPIVITALGSPAAVVEVVHSYGGLVFADVNSVKYAKKAAQTGVDGLVLVSAGAGGHTGTMTGFAFVEAVREFWDGIIVLGGGISTGRGILAAQALGADLAYMGTKFIAATESMASDEYRKMIVSATAEDLICTNAFTGVNANMLIPSIERAGLDVANLQPKGTIDFDDPTSNKKAWKEIWSAGQGVGTIREIQPAEALVLELLQEYHSATEEMHQMIVNNAVKNR